MFGAAGHWKKVWRDTRSSQLLRRLQDSKEQATTSEDGMHWAFIVKVSSVGVVALVEAMLISLNGTLISVSGSWIDRAASLGVMLTMVSMRISRTMFWELCGNEGWILMDIAEGSLAI